jgi:hypothetical protein
MKVKVVEGVWGNRVAADYRRGRLPMKAVEAFFLWLSVAVIVATPFVFGALFAIVFLFD